MAEQENDIITQEQEAKQKLEAIKQEREELRLLIGNGISFVVTYFEPVVVKIPRWGNWLGRLFKRKVRQQRERQREFTIKEPTLYTLDRLSMEYIELHIEEAKLKAAPRQQARLYYKEHSKRMALICAIAILGNEWEDKKKLEELAAFLHRWLKNSQLMELVSVVDLTNNLADFINSIRLVSSARTTMPSLIEQSNEG